ncbi:MAG: hypothetical protein ACRD0P_29030, partial [Stackebrandtia sp.]
MEAPAMIPAFAREIETMLPMCSQFLLHGNVRDRYLVDDNAMPVPLRKLLWEIGRELGYGCLLCYHPVIGIEVYPETTEAEQAATELFPDKPWTAKKYGHDSLLNLIRTVSDPPRQAKRRAMLLVDQASRLAVSAEHLE